MAYERQKDIFVYLLNSDIGLSGNELAKKFNVSSRTIRSDIKFLNELTKEYGVSICSSKQGSMLDMKRIFLLCSAGMSTSLLVSKMKEAAKKQGYECDIAASSLANLKDIKDKADVILLGPQVRFDKERVEKETNIPVGVVDMAAYGMMDGEKALNQARKLLGEL